MLQQARDGSGQADMQDGQNAAPISLGEKIARAIAEHVGSDDHRQCEEETEISLAGKGSGGQEDGAGRQRHEQGGKKNMTRSAQYL